jgi:hypothetical protein
MCQIYRMNEFRMDYKSGGVGIAQLVYRRATGWTAPIRFPAVQDLSLLHSVQPHSGAHPASYPMGTVGSFPRNKAAGA